MFGTMFCQYETPCGWCAKFDKPCTEKRCKPKSNGIYHEKVLQEKKYRNVGKAEV